MGVICSRKGSTTIEYLRRFCILDTIEQHFNLIFITVLSQALEAGTRSEAAIIAAREVAAKTIAEAETAKQSAIAEAKTSAQKTVEDATATAQTKADKEATAIAIAAEKEATTVKEAVTAKADELQNSVIEAFKAG